MSTVNPYKPGVEVCVWIARDAKRNYTNAYTGAVNEPHGGRVGHASLKIYPSSEDQQTFSSLMISGNDHVYVSLWPGRFEKTHADDVSLEGELPNAIVRLNHLHIFAMLTELSKVVDANWTLKTKVTTPLKDAQSCSSFVYKLLEIGGIFKEPIYGTSTRYGGPRNWDFYYKTNSHLGDILGGMFNSFGWRAWAISPKLVLHISASAAEAIAADKEDTIALMNSSYVHKDQPTSNVKTIAETAVAATAVVGTVIYAGKKFGAK